MRTVAPLLCLLLVACSSVHQRALPAGQDRNDSAELLEFDKAWCDAYRNSDVAWFEHNLADDAVIVLGNGATLSKTEEVAAIRKGHTPLESFTSSDSVFHIDGDLAVETSIAHATVRDATGQLILSNYLSSTAYVRRNGRWLALLDHVTLIKQ